jgi:endonuclease YncB( thermonuclease family)
MVESGHALAYRQYSRDYVKQEQGARKGKRGVWKGKFVKPWEWR